jgi:CRAL/TRIO domain
MKIAMTITLSFQLAVLMLLLKSPFIEGKFLSHGMGAVVGPAFVGRVQPQERQRRTMEDSWHYLQLHPVAARLQVPQASMINMEIESVPAAGHTSPHEHPWSQSNLDRCSSLWKLTPDQIIQLKQLHEKLTDIGGSKHNTPFALVRFVKEYKGNLRMAESKFRAMIHWREMNHVDQLLDINHYKPPSLFRYFPAGVLQGVDRDGDPIHCERTGVADSDGLLRRYGRDEMLKQAVWIREIQSRGKWHHDYEYQHGHPVKHFTVVLDMQGLKARNIGPALISVGQQVSRIVQDYYPSYAKRIIVIRAPAIFQMAYNAVKPYLDDSMRKKITIASGKNHCQILDQYMDLQVLPNVICEEGRGQVVEDFGSVVWTGGKIPDREEHPSSIVLKEQKKVQSKIVLPHSQDSTLGPALLKRNSPGNTTHAACPRRRMPLSWIRRQLQLFQATFTSFDENHDAGLPDAL